jgi:cytochrome d ubiquinol oxidase subunit I
VKGLKDFPAQDRGPIILPFYSFRLMVLIGFIMVFMMLWALWYWFKGNLKYENTSRHKWFWRIWYWGLPFGFIATELGWITREVGRQPWVIYGIMRTSEGISNLTAEQVMATLVAFILTYVVLFVIFIAFTRKILKTGPDLKSPLPDWTKETKKNA